MATSTATRGQWGSRMGFIMAATGSAVGLGNIWKFPYITGQNGGGLFVVIYLAAIALVGLPIMIAEIMIGRAAQASPVGAFEGLSKPGSPWSLIGYLGVATSTIVLSYYSIVAGWSLHYAWLSLTGGLSGLDVDAIGNTFGTVHASPGINIGWHFVFIAITSSVVAGGVSGGIERASKILMPALFLLMSVLLFDAFSQPGFWPAVKFVFQPDASEISAAAVLEAVGHSFFTLSLGMGAMLTYGSYLPKDTDIVKTSALISVLDTVIALVACLVLFPVIFTFGMQPQAGPGLVFKSIPIALSQVTGGRFLSIAFFFLLFFAALSSAIAMLEVAASTLIDRRGWTRKRTCAVMAGVTFVLGIPSALSGAGGFFEVGMEKTFGRSFFDLFDYLATNWALPLSAFFMAIFVGWVIPAERRRAEFADTNAGRVIYTVWLTTLRYVCPVAIFVLFLFATGILPETWLGKAPE